MKNRYYFSLVMFFIAGMFCLWITAPVVLSSIRYLGINQEIEETRNTYNAGTTAEGRDREVNRLMEERAKMAEEDPIFAMLFSAHSDSTAKKGRDTMVIACIILFMLGIVLSVSSATKFIINLMEKRKKVRNQDTKVRNTEITKKANPFDGFDEVAEGYFSKLQTLMNEGEAEIKKFEKEIKAR